MSASCGDSRQYPNLGLIATAAACLIAATASGQEPLPADIDPATRNRLSAPAPNGSTAVERIVARGSGTIVRWEFAPGRALSELAILSTAREHDQPYEWSLHELEAMAVGLDTDVIGIVRERRPLDALDETEAVIVQTAREIFGQHALSSATYARALGLLGESNLVDLSG